ncbi:sugar transferase [Aquisediminimonas sediminicola]|uniref:sugar transferase n=1 Tax=Alteraquisediminimonas sediminicola TaxID=2676787 RepID=UPI001FEA295A|nr:sugar transferase [Aquisediminimonas sediminicola]
MNQMTPNATNASTDTPNLIAPRTTSTHQVRAILAGAQMLLDLCGIWLAFTLADGLLQGHPQVLLNIQMAASFSPIFLLLAYYEQAYLAEVFTCRNSAASRILWALGCTLAIHLLLLRVTGQYRTDMGLLLIGGTVAALPLLIALRMPIIWLVRHRLRDGFMRRILISDGGSIAGIPMTQRIDVDTLGIFPDADDPLMFHHFSCLIHGADHVFVDCPPERRALWSVYLKAIPCSADILLPEMGHLPSIGDQIWEKNTSFRIFTGPVSLGKRMRKRVFDLCLTVPVLVVLTPLLLAIALAIKWDSPGPVLFRQTRMGRSNRLFNIYKFRSMRAERTDHIGAQSATPNDDRITRIGRMLRSTSMDELPQLFNVLAGDMSLVGPRPHALGSRAGEQLFWHVDRRYWFRHAIKPGITGLAQVRGQRGATDHPHELAARLQSDLEYVANCSILNDIVILIRTLLVLVHQKAY